MTAEARLAALETRARWELDALGYPAREWVPARTHAGERVYDVVIVGGGQSGLSIAFRLMRERVTNILVLDRNGAGAEGPWNSFARMTTLRTPKTVCGPELGIPSLSARAWYEARFGGDAWRDLGKIPRLHWHAYLQWLRAIIGLPVQNETDVTDVEPIEDGLLAVHLMQADGTRRPIFTRNIVLATGIEGTGRWFVPAAITKALPPERFAHTADAIAFADLAGKRVVVVGAGASAFDNAAMALEHGAAHVVLLGRRAKLPLANPNRWMEFAGFMRHFGDLDDDTKWRFMKLIFERNQPPPQDTFERCARFSNFEMKLGCPLDAVRFEGNEIVLETPAGTTRADFLIAGTGFIVDVSARPELRRFSADIACWSDRFTPPLGMESDTLGRYPYLSPYFQFTEKMPGRAPCLKNIFSYTFAAMPSLAGSAGISALKFGVERIAFGLTRNLFVEDAAAHFESLNAYNDAELDLSSYFANNLLPVA